MFMFWPCFSSRCTKANKQSYTLQNNYHKNHKRKRKQAKPSKQWTGTKDWLSNIPHYLNEAHVALISAIEVVWFSSHNNGSVFRCFVDSLYSWRFTENNHLTSTTKHCKFKRFMWGKKYTKIKTRVRRGLGTPKGLNHIFYYFIIAILSFANAFQFIKKSFFNMIFRARKTC